MLKNTIGSQISGLDLSNSSSTSKAQPSHILASNGMQFVVKETRQGGMGQVYIAELQDDENKQQEPVHVALKSFAEKYFFNSAITKSLRQEIGIWARLESTPFVFPLISVIEIDHKPHIMMPVARSDIDGVYSVADALKLFAQGLDDEACFRLIFCLCLALQHGSQQVEGLVHGDIKPDNILYLGMYPHLADFGLSRTRAQLSQRGGTPAYMAPELWAKGAKPTVLTDIYAIGVLLFEVLTGMTPFEGANMSAEDFANAHQNLSVQFPSQANDSELRIGLKNLTLRCLEKNPIYRVQNFKVLIDDLNELDPVATIMLLSHAAQTRSVMIDANNQQTPIKIESLLRQGDFQTARALLDSLPAKAIEGEMIMTAGTTYSLSGDDEGALRYFEQFLETKPEPSDKYRCCNEMGLSLKRLGRLDEAKALYQQLLQEVDNDQLEMVRANLAATLNELGDNEDAEMHLDWLNRHYPDGAPSAALRAGVKMALGKVDEALAAAQCAVSLVPSQGHYRLILGEVLLLGKKDPIAAVTALHQAYELDFQSQRWLELSISASLAAGDESEALYLMNCAKDESEAFAKDVERNVMSILSELTSDKPGQGNNLQEVDRASFEENNARNKEETENKKITERGDYDKEAHRLSLQNGETIHFQTRISSLDSSFALDYYNVTGNSSYAEAFVKGYKQGTRQLQHLYPNYSERTAGYRFIACEACHFIILSPRDEGEKIRCQACGQEGRVLSINKPELAPLLKECLRVFARETSEKPTNIVLGIWMFDDIDESCIAKLFEVKGFEYIAKDSMAYAMVRYYMAKRGKQFESFPDGVWIKRFTQLNDSGSQETPLEIDQLVRQLRRDFGDIGSCSMSLSDEQINNFITPGENQVCQARKLLENDIDDTKLRQSLITNELLRGKFKTAKEDFALMDLLFPNDPYTCLARAHMAFHEEDWQVTLNNAERVIEELPRELFSYLLAAESCIKLGREAEAKMHYSTYTAHGGQNFTEDD